MPKEYIERDALIEDIKNDCLEQVYYSKEDAIWCVKASPAADVVEVVHSEWIEHEGYSECKHCHMKTVWPHNYCSKCGAKMDGERRE